MRKKLALAAAVAVVALTVGVASVAFSSPGPKAKPAKPKVHVIEHAVTDTVIDIGDPGDSTGDLLTFHNELFDSSDSTVVGSDQGECIRIDPVEGTWECRWTNFLDGGQITVEGPFFDAADSLVSVTGGTGKYRNVRGEMSLESRLGGTEFDFIFTLLG